MAYIGLHTLHPAILISSLPIINAQVNNCENDSTGFIPIVDMVTGKYMGYSGGLYPMSSNEAPAAHAKNGVYIAKTIDETIVEPGIQNPYYYLITLTTPLPL